MAKVIDFYKAKAEIEAEKNPLSDYSEASQETFEKFLEHWKKLRDMQANLKRNNLVDFKTKGDII